MIRPWLAGVRYLLRDHADNCRVRLVRHYAAGLGAMAPALRRAADGELMTAGDLGRLALELGERLAEATEATAAGLGAVDLVAVHGQTIVHRPPVSWQLVNPAPVAARLACPVVFDLRQADLAAGGQGAPITPIADWVIFRAPGVRRAIVNLGARAPGSCRGRAGSRAASACPNPGSSGSRWC